VTQTGSTLSALEVCWQYRLAAGLQHSEQSNGELVDGTVGTRRLRNRYSKPQMIEEAKRTYTRWPSACVLFASTKRGGGSSRIKPHRLNSPILEASKKGVKH
jgi:hypothetical protein